MQGEEADEFYFGDIKALFDSGYVDTLFESGAISENLDIGHLEEEFFCGEIDRAGLSFDAPVLAVEADGGWSFNQYSSVQYSTTSDII
jgi:hypothetical protein